MYIMIVYYIYFYLIIYFYTIEYISESEPWIFYPLDILSVKMGNNTINIIINLYAHYYTLLYIIIVN